MKVRDSKFALKRGTVKSQTCSVRLIRYLIGLPERGVRVRKPKPTVVAVAWLQSLEVGQGFFSAVTFGGNSKRVWNSRADRTCKGGAEIEAWAAQLERTSQVLSMDAVCFREYARLMRRRSET